MNNIWKYKIAVTDKDIFKKIEREYGIQIPLELKDFIIENNAATPSKYKFMMGDTEKVFGAVLSFNDGESDMDSFFDAISVIENTNIFPFGIDPFGNYICYVLNSNIIVFWDHETDKLTKVSDSLTNFLTALYE